MAVPVRGGRRGYLLQLFLGLCFCASAFGESIRLVDVFPFGVGEADSEVPAGNDGSVTVQLATPILYFGELREAITSCVHKTINTPRKSWNPAHCVPDPPVCAGDDIQCCKVYIDGVLELTGASSSASVRVYSADADTRTLGSVFYRETTSPELLEVSSALFSAGFNATNFTSMFIATWFYVGYYDGGVDLTNTFQCAIATNGEVTSICLIYPEDLIEWTTGDGDGGMGGLGGDPADVGLMAPASLSNNSFFLPDSNTSDIVDIESTTNVMLDGLWIFRADGEAVSFPDLVDGSGSGSGSGDMMDTMGRCEMLGFQECCVANCGSVIPGAPDCFCDQRCIMAGDCCSDVVAIGCSLNISLNFEAPSYSFLESDTSAEVVITVSNFSVAQNLSFFSPPITASFVLAYSHDGTAEAPEDYNEVLQVIPIETGDDGGFDVTIPITIVDDQISENTEFFSVNITSTDQAIFIGQGSTQVSILDNEQVVVGLEQTSYEVSEGAGSIEVCVVTLLGNTGVTLGRPIPVNINTVPSGAIDPDDYEGVSMSLEIPADGDRVCINISIVDDSLYEDLEEVFSVCIDSDDALVTVAFSKAEVTIVDNNEISAGFVPTSYIVMESNSFVTLSVGVTGILARPLELDIAFDSGTAQLFEDFLPASPSFTIEIPAGVNPTLDVMVNIDQDGIVEESEAFTASLTATNPASDPNLSVAPAEASVTILDSDVVEAVVSATSYQAEEALEVISVCVTISGASLARQVLVNVMTMANSAQDPNDYIGLSMVDLTFEPSGPSVECEDIIIIRDFILEDDETFTFAISPSQSDIAVNVGSPSSAVVTIVDDPAVFFRFAFNDNSVSINENTGMTSVCVTLTTNAAAITNPIILDMEFILGTASFSDFNTASTLSFMDVSSTMSCIVLNIVNDILIEFPVESFTINLIQPEGDHFELGVPSSITVSIVDNDVLSVAFEMSSYMAVEGQADDTEVCLLVQSGQLSSDISLSADLSTSLGSATPFSDYNPTPMPSVVTFTSQDSRLCVSLNIVDDVVVESAENFFVVASSQDSRLFISGSSSVSVVISDNDEFEDCIVGFLSSTINIFDEGDEDGAEACVRLTSAGGLSTSVTVRIVSSDIDAVANEDYLPVDEIIEFIPTTQTAVTDCIRVKFIDDNVPEPEETLRLTISETTCSTLLFETIVFIGNDDGDVIFELGFEEPQYSALEDDANIVVAEVCVSSLFIPAPQPFVVSLVVTPTSFGLNPATVGTDFLISGPINIPQGSLRGCTTLSIFPDSILEGDEVFGLSLSTTAMTDPLRSTSIFIIEDSADLSVTFSASSTSVSESAGVLTVFVTVSLNGNLQTPISVDVFSADITTQANVDYVTVEETLTFSQAGTQQFQVTIIDDNIVEGVEMFQLNLLSVDFPQIAGELIVSITEDGSEGFVTVAFEGANIQQVDENTISEPLEVCFGAPSGAISSPIVVRITTQPGSAVAGMDYVAIDEERTLTQTVNRQCVPVEIINDDVAELLESFSVVLESDDSFFISGSNLVIQILENDVMPRTAAFVPQMLFVPETDFTVEICFQVSDNSVGSFQVIVSTVDSTAVSPADFDSNTVTFNSVLEGCFPFDINSDLEEEDDETVIVSLQLIPVGGTAFTTTASVVIIDNDGVGDNIHLIDQTPSVSLDGNDGVITVRFATGGLVASVFCQIDNGGFSPCGGQGPDIGEMSFGGLNPDTRTPITIILEARDVAGNVIETINRRVRLGLNRDCSVIFVNGDENGIQSINGDLFLEFIPIGPVEITECRFELEPRPVGQPFGDFVPCESPFQIQGLDPATYTIKVRALGPTCEREVRRRTGEFVIPA